LVRRALAGAGVGVLLAILVAAPAQAETVRQRQWYLDALHVPEAQQVTRGDGVVVAVVEADPVDPNIPELQGQVLPGFGPNNGWSEGADAAHGTAMAGVIAAKGGSGHTLGVAPGARILPVDVHGVDNPLATGIRWAVDHGAKVINVSSGMSGPPLPADQAAVRYALDHDAVVIAAAGNVSEGAVGVGSPANVPGVVAVSGVDRNGGAWSGSTHGPEVTIGAPAIDILVPGPTAATASGYATTEGTSDATAIVSGTAALVRAKFPNLNAANVIQRLIATAKDQPPAGRDEDTGFGTVRVLDALTKDVPPVGANPLGQPSSTGSSGVAAPGHGSTSGGGKLVLFGIIAALVVLVIVVAIVIVVAVNRPKRPPVRQPSPPAYPPPPPGYPPRR
jgi:subtilisin family serine protease